VSNSFVDSDANKPMQSSFFGPCCAIELDGGQHNEPDARARDEQRTAFLKARGICVLRFWNNEVLTETEGVLQEVYEAVSRSPQP
ncbi:MAG: endonuclease domain-containing protein, partial [Desulfomonilaceae bacterium]